MALQTSHPQPANMIDRRTAPAYPPEHWEHMNLAQQFAFYTLTKLGYQLLFVRQQMTELAIAVACLNEQLATIDAAGDIHFSPDIWLRSRTDKSMPL